MLELRNAVYTVLANDTTLTALLGDGAASVLETGELDPQLKLPILEIHSGEINPDGLTMQHAYIEIRAYDNDGSYYNIDKILERTEYVLLNNNLTWDEAAVGYGWCQTELTFTSSTQWSDVFKMEFRYKRFLVYVMKLGSNKNYRL